MITWMKKMNNFQKVKVQLQGVAWLLLDVFTILILVLLVKMLLIKSAAYCFFSDKYGGEGIKFLYFWTDVKCE